MTSPSNRYVNTHNVSNGIVLQQLVLLAEGDVLPVGVVVDGADQLGGDVQVLHDVLAVLAEEGAVLTADGGDDVRSQLADVGSAVVLLSNCDGQIDDAADMVLHVRTAGSTMKKRSKAHSMQESSASNREIRSSSSPFWKASWMVLRTAGMAEEKVMMMASASILSRMVKVVYSKEGGKSTRQAEI